MRDAQALQHAGGPSEARGDPVVGASEAEIRLVADRDPAATPAQRRHQCRQGFIEAPVGSQDPAISLPALRLEGVQAGDPLLGAGGALQQGAGEVGVQRHGAGGVAVLGAGIRLGQQDVGGAPQLGDLAGRPAEGVADAAGAGGQVVAVVDADDDGVPLPRQDLGHLAGKLGVVPDAAEGAGQRRIHRVDAGAHDPRGLHDGFPLGLDHVFGVFQAFFMALVGDDLPERLPGQLCAGQLPEPPHMQRAGAAPALPGDEPEVVVDHDGVRARGGHGLQGVEDIVPEAGIEGAGGVGLLAAVEAGVALEGEHLA